MPDCLLVNGRIHTMDARRPPASALAIGGERVLALGDDPAALRSLLAPGAEVVDLGGRCVLPGLADSHVHFFMYALGLRTLDLSAAASLDEMLALVAGRAREAAAGEWVVGRGWDQERWPERGFPTAADLDGASPASPVLLTAKSLHASVANSRALELAGIGAGTPDPPGGRIGRDGRGSPDGMLFEGSAMRLVEELIPLPGEAELDTGLRRAFDRAWRVGLTSIHDVDGFDAFAAFQRLHARGELGLRVCKYLPPDALDMDLRPGQGDDRLRVSGIKLFVDGALGPRTAAMLAPYAGEPENVGILTLKPDGLREIVRRAVASGWPLAMHAIGDRANRLALDVLAEVGTGGLRHRIEHVQLLHPGDVDRLARLGVVASVQPIHATQDCEMADRTWGDRCAAAYAWRSLLDAGTVLAFGSDCPVEDIDPFLGIHAAVTRRRVDGFPGREGWFPGQRLAVAEAVRGYTWGAAYAAGLEDDAGSLAPGRFADLIVLDRDPFDCDPMAIAGTRVLATMIGGRFVYEEGL